MQTADDIVKFWFVDHGQEDWFGSAPEFDVLLYEKFFDLHAAVCAGEVSSWRKTPEGRLAEIIVLDQFSRQFYRDKAKAFANDTMALVLAQELVASGQDKMLDDDKRTFAYMPFMHSESLNIHDEAVRLFTAMGNEGLLKFEISHRDLITEFGRFPKRNAALGRASTKLELAYMAERDGKMF